MTIPVIHADVWTNGQGHGDDNHSAQRQTARVMCASPAWAIPRGSLCSAGPRRRPSSAPPTSIRDRRKNDREVQVGARVVPGEYAHRGIVQAQHGILECSGADRPGDSRCQGTCTGDADLPGPSRGQYRQKRPFNNPGGHTLRILGQRLPAAGARYEAIVTYTGTQELP